MRLLGPVVCLIALLILCACVPPAAPRLPERVDPSQTSGPNPSSSEVTPDTSLSDEMDAYLQKLAAAGLSGAALVARDGEILLSQGYGSADLAGTIPATDQTVYDTGSLSKQFTAAAILSLEEAGLLSVEDRLADFFPDAPEEKAEITLHQLLTHSSGLPGYVYDGDYTRLSRERAVGRALNAALLFQPGERYAYSDTGYGLLAAIVEIVSGQPFQEYMQERLFRPAGMESTGFAGDPRWEGKTVAESIVNGRGYGTPADQEETSWGLLGFGGVLTTVSDLYRWHTALQERQVLSQSSIEKLFTPYVDEGFGDGSQYAYGWVVMEYPGAGTLILHDGASNAHHAIFLHMVDQDTLVVVLSNRIDGDADDEIMYGIDTGFALGNGLVKGHFEELPPFAER